MDFERQYAESLKQLLENGVRCKNRTGIDTLKLPVYNFSTKNVGLDFPTLKGKKVFPKMSLKEMCWMMMGKTDIQWLNDRGVKYWDKWSDDKGTIGKSYGYQFRNFNGVDNLQTLINDLINDPLSRRLIMNIWNSNDLSEMSLPPCVYDYQIDCTNIGTESLGEESCIFDVNLLVTQRSSDAFLGVPYDIMGDAWFLLIVCVVASRLSKYVFIPRDVYHCCKNYHLYVNHIDQAKQYIANVEENKNQVIDMRQELNIDNNFDFKSLDEYLEIIAELKYLNFSLSHDFNDEYGQIKAEVAI